MSGHARHAWMLYRVRYGTVPISPAVEYIMQVAVRVRRGEVSDRTEQPCLICGARRLRHPHEWITDMNPLMLFLLVAFALASLHLWQSVRCESVASQRTLAYM
jgi:hypothetical protein